MFSHIVHFQNFERAKLAGSPSQGPLVPTPVSRSSYFCHTHTHLLLKFHSHASAKLKHSLSLSFSLTEMSLALANDAHTPTHGGGRAIWIWETYLRRWDLDRNPQFHLELPCVNFKVKNILGYFCASHFTFNFQLFQERLQRLQTSILQYGW